MPDAKLSPSLSLLMPSYRRWLTPDMAEVKIATRGIDPAALEHAQSRYVVTDFETDQTTQRVFEIDPGEADLVFPAPKLHSSGELLIVLEDERNETLIAEGRWRMTAIRPEDQAASVYFDFRKVMMAGGEATAPRIWESDVDWTARSSPVSLLQSLRGLGFDTLLLPRAGLELGTIKELAAQAGAAEIRLIVSPLPIEGRLNDAEIAKTKERVRELRGLAGLIGYALPVPKDGFDGAVLEEFYRAIRSTDVSRPVFLSGVTSDQLTKLSGFQDCVVLDATDRQTATGWDTARLAGLATFGRIAVAPGAGDDPRETALFRQLRHSFYSQLVEGSSGAIWAGPEAVLSSRALQQSVAEAKTLANLLRRGFDIAWPVDPAARARMKKEGLTLSQRRIDDQFIVIAIRHGEAAKSLQFPVPPSPARLHVLGENRQIDIENNIATDDFDAWRVHVYTNDVRLADSVTFGTLLGG